MAITRDSIKGAFALGIQAHQILRFLEKHAHPKLRTSGTSPIPANVVVDQVYLWDRERHRVEWNGVFSHTCVMEGEFQAVQKCTLELQAHAWSNAGRNQLFIKYPFAEQVQSFVSKWRVKNAGGSQHNTNNSFNDDDDIIEEVYIYQGKDGEQVPATVENLVIRQDIRILPDELCCEFERLKEVILPHGLNNTGKRTFKCCKNLLEVKNCSMVKHIGMAAFAYCKRLRKVDFSSLLPHHRSKLQTIYNQAFDGCASLERIKLPCSVTSVGEEAFCRCTSLVEANLSTTGLTEISNWAFACCRSLQTVCLPNTLERICDCAFHECLELVTVVVPLDYSQPIKIGDWSFNGCQRLAVLVLPKDSTAVTDSFSECQLLHERYGEDSSRIVAGLVGRFENYAIHRLCYDHSTVTVQELRKCIADQQEEGSLVDEFGMTPFHVFFSTIEPRIELLDVLLESLPLQTLLKLKDCNERRPLGYLMNNWTGGASNLLQRALQKWIIDRLDRWGATSWMEAMESKVKHLLAEDNNEERARLYDELYCEFEHYENLEATSILEMALWKWKLKSGWTSDGTKGQALDRDECRYLSGSDVVIPHVAMFFLGIPRSS